MTLSLEGIFSACFAQSHDTCLLGGAAEPLYQPSSDRTRPHTIYYREDYFSSALHEVAHWCMAGDARRARLDYGYWYAPDGRDRIQQRQFELVEVRPQAVEWHFSLAADVPFRVSMDNLDGDSPDAADFLARVRAEAISMIGAGLPPRAEIFRDALALHYGGAVQPTVDNFELSRESGR